MKLGIISDTHDRLTTIDHALDLLISHGVSEIIHCGDWTKPETMAYIATRAAKAHLPVYGVLGNRDDMPALASANKTLATPIHLPADLEVLRLVRDSRNIVVYHGHHKPTLRKLIDNPAVDLILTGHTHAPLIEALPDTLIVNPGSTAFSIPRSKAPRSVAVYDSLTGTAELLYFSLATP